VFICKYRNEQKRTCFRKKKINVTCHTKVSKFPLNTNTFRGLAVECSSEIPLICGHETQGYLSVNLSKNISLWLYSPSGPRSLLQFLNLYTVGRTPSTGDQPVEGRYLHTEQHKHRIKSAQISKP
jgi:hypothetical protein